MQPDLNKWMDNIYNNERAAMDMMNMYNMMMMPGGVPPPLPGMPHPHAYPSIGGSSMFHPQSLPQQNFHNISNSPITEPFKNNSPIDLPKSEPVQNSRIPESIMESIPKTAKMMTVEDLERALLAKK